MLLKPENKIHVEKKTWLPSPSKAGVHSVVICFNVFSIILITFFIQNHIITSFKIFLAMAVKGGGGGRGLGDPTFNGQCPLKNMGIVSRRPLIKVPIVNPRGYCTRSMVKVK